MSLNAVVPQNTVGVVNSTESLSPAARGNEASEAMTFPSNYPATVVEVLDPPARFRAATLAAVRRLASSRPWRGSIEERQAKFRSLHDELRQIYGKKTMLSFGVL